MLVGTTSCSARLLRLHVCGDADTSPGSNSGPQQRPLQQRRSDADFRGDRQQHVQDSAAWKDQR